MSMSRKDFLGGLVAASAAVPAVAGEQGKAGTRDAVVYVSCHPDDMAGSLGTIYRLKELYDVHVVEFTHGERGLGEEHYRDGTCARMRTAEDEAVCRELGVPLHWCNEIDGEAFAGREACEFIANLFRELKPRAIIVHSLIETHLDHMMSAAAAIKAAQMAKLSPEIYFQEQDVQSRGFQPAYYVDVSELTAFRRRVISLWACQAGPKIAERKIQTSMVNRWRIGGIPGRDTSHYEVFGMFPGTVPPGKGIFDELPRVRR